MIKTRTRKIFGDIMARKGRTALVVLSIVIGVFGVVTLVGMNDLVVSQLNEDMNPDEITMTHVYVISQGQPITMEENRAFLDSLSKLPGVQVVEGQAIYLADWKRAEEASDVNSDFETGNILAFTEPFGEVKLEPPSRLVEGRYPQPGKNEIAVEQRFVEEYGVNIGDKLVFRELTGGGSEPQEWEIVGLVFHPYFTISVAVGDNIEPANNIYAAYEDAQQIAGFPGLSSFYARYPSVDEAKVSLNQFLEAVSTETPYIPVFSWVDNPDDSFIIGQVQSVTGVMNVLAALAMIVSGFLVTNVINSIVIEQKRQIGLMKSLGASRWDNFFIYAGMALIYGIIGTFFGVLLGIPTALLLAKALDSLALTYISGFQVSIVAVVLGIVMGLLIPVLASLIPVFNGTRVTILDAMTDFGISSNWGKTRLSRFIGRLPLPINIRQAFSNIAQKKGRLVLTGITLTLAVGAFMGVTAVFTSLGTQIDAIFDTFNYEISMSPQKAQDFEELRTLITENVDGVEDVFAGYGVAVAVEGYESTDPISQGSNQLSGFGIDTTSPVIQFTLDEGTGWSEDPTRQGVVLTGGLADKLKKGVGDSVVVSVAGQSHEYEIIGVDTFPFDFIYFDWQELATIAGFVDDENKPLPGTFYVSLTGNPTVEDVDHVIEQMTTVMLANGIQGVYNNQPKTEEEQAASLDLFSLILNMTSGVMAAVGAIGLLAALSMAVYERQKEIGVMRSIGAGSTTIVTQFLVEGILVGILAWIVAVPLSFGIGRVLAGGIGFGHLI